MQNIGVVTQEAYLFNGTIRENLLYAKPDATEAEFTRARSRTSLARYRRRRRPTRWSETAGQAQRRRKALARVVLKDPKILVLDEATSSLDSISENAIQNALDVVMKGRTSIVIAHRLSTVLAADRILVVKDGVIAEQGTHEELLGRSGVYRELYETQFQRVLEHDAE